MLTWEQIGARVAREVGEGMGFRAEGELPAPLASHLPAPSNGVGPAALTIVHAAWVSATGDVASEGGLSGAMPAPDGRGRLVAVMRHVDEEGTPRIVRECPVTDVARGVVHRIITDLAVIDVTADGLLLREVAPKVSAREVQAYTEAPLLAGPDLRPIEL